MRSHRRRLISCGILIAVCTVLFGVASGFAQDIRSQGLYTLSQSKPTVAQAGNRRAKSNHNAINTGFFVGLVFPYHKIGGDFTGTTYLFDQDQVVLFPKVKPSVGFGAAIGRRGPFIDMELSWSHSESEGSFGDFRPKIKYYVFTLGSKMMLLPRSRVKPFLEFGVGILKLVVRDGSYPTDPAEPEYWRADSRFSYAFRQFGGGIALEANSRLRFQMSFLYRLSSFGRGDIEGVAGVIYPPRAIKANAFIITMGPTYVF